MLGIYSIEHCEIEQIKRHRLRIPIRSFWHWCRIYIFGVEFKSRKANKLRYAEHTSMQKTRKIDYLIAIWWNFNG